MPWHEFEKDLLKKFQKNQTYIKYTKRCHSDRDHDVMPPAGPPGMKEHCLRPSQCSFHFWRPCKDRAQGALSALAASTPIHGPLSPATHLLLLPILSLVYLKLLSDSFFRFLSLWAGKVTYISIYLFSEIYFPKCACY